MSQTKAAMDDAIAKLDGATVRGSTIRAKVAKRAGGEIELEDKPVEKRQKTAGKAEEPPKDINDIVTPMWRLDYSDQVDPHSHALTTPTSAVTSWLTLHTNHHQVRKKRNVVLKKLKAVQKEIRKKSAYDLPRWIAQAKTTSQCCSFKLFIQAEESQRDGYRNKNTFTIGRDVAGAPHQPPRAHRSPPS